VGVGGGLPMAADSSRFGCTVDSRFRLVALASAAGLSACSMGGWQGFLPSDGAPMADGSIFIQDAGGPAGLDVGKACDVLNQAKCQRLWSCGLLSADGGVAACVAAEQRLSCGPTTWASHVASGALRYDGLAAQACAESWRTIGCEGFANPPPPCARMLVPNAGLQQSCYDGYDECRDGVCRGSVCPRQCLPVGLAGDVCTFDTDCRADLGLFCQLSSTRLGVGQCAVFAQLDQPCDDLTRCLAGLTCLANQCKQLPVAGAACLLGACDEKSVCVTTSDGGVCLSRKGLGEPCQAAQCTSSLVCVSGSCAPEVLSVVGAPCAAEQTCPGGTTCVGLTAGAPGSCLFPLGDGAGCVAHRDCAAELACVQHDGGLSCARRQALGSSCDSSRACQLDAVCALGVCVRAPLIREPCTADKQCGEGMCVAVDAGFVCAPLKGSLAACRRDSECSSGACIWGVCRAACSP